MFPAHWASIQPGKTAVIVADTGEALSYAELDERSRRLANTFEDMGLEPGDHISVLLDNSAHFLEIVWAALLSGLHISPISSHATTDDAAYVVVDSNSKVMITGARLAATVGEIPTIAPDCRYLMLGDAATGFESYEQVLASARTEERPSDVPMGEYMLYSSGTTGRPKGVLRPLSGRSVADGTIANRMLTRVFGADDTSVYLSPAPLYHGAPLGFCMGITSLGGTVVLMTKFEAESSLAAIEQYAVTHSQWVPTMFTRMLSLDEGVRASYDVSSQRVAIHSAAPCPRHVKEAMFAWWGPILHEYYSGTEDVGICYASPQDWLAHPGTVGRPLGFALHICDDDGRELGPGETGRVFFETRNRGFNYHKDDKKTASARHPEHPSWVTLDDVGHLDEDGFLYLTDRASFMIISGGVNVYPQEVEDVLVTHPKIADVAVIGLSDDDLGERVVAVVEPARGVAVDGDLEAELTAFSREHLAGPKRPRTWEFVETLPRLPTGKLAKRQIRDTYQQPATSGEENRR